MIVVEFVAYNESGRRIGQTHHRAKLTDEQVDQIRDLHEYEQWSYLRISKKFGVSKGAVAWICQYKKRVDTIAEWRALKAKRKG